MNENPFEQSTLTQSTSTSPSNSAFATDDGVEVRYPDIQRKLIPAALLCSSIIAPVVLFFVLPPPEKFLISGVVAVMEITTALFFWLLFGLTVMRADSRGVTKVQLGSTKTVPWNQIDKMEMRQVGNGAMQIILKSREGNVLIQLSDCGNRRDGERLIDYIESHLPG